MRLGETTLLEAGQSWDLALLKLTPVGDGLATGPVVLPLQEQDPQPRTNLLTTAFPEDAASRHDATYEAAGAPRQWGSRWSFCGSRPTAW